MIGSHNKPPPPSNDRAFIAAVSGEPETPLKDGGADPDGKELPLVGAVGIDIKDASELGASELDGGKLDGVDTGIGGNPDIILENSTGSIPDGIGVPEAAAAAIISAGVGSKVPVITL